MQDGEISSSTARASQSEREGGYSISKGIGMEARRRGLSSSKMRLRRLPRGAIDLGVGVWYTC